MSYQFDNDIGKNIKSYRYSINSINKYKFIAVILSILIGIIIIYFITNYHLFGLNLIKNLTNYDAIVYTTMNTNSIHSTIGCQSKLMKL